MSHNYDKRSNRPALPVYVTESSVIRPAPKQGHYFQLHGFFPLVRRYRMRGIFKGAVSRCRARISFIPVRPNAWTLTRRGGYDLCSLFRKNHEFGLRIQGFS